MKRKLLSTEENATHQDAALDEALSESFPASDPIAVSFLDAATLRSSQVQVNAIARNREIELKLQIDPAHINQLIDHPLLKKYSFGKVRHEQLVSTYYDTSDFALEQQQAALRLRRTSRGWVQTFKCDGAPNAVLHSRKEWEAPVAGAELDINALLGMIGAGTSWGKFLRDAQLQPIFTTEFSRTLWDLQLPTGEQIELVLDRGVVRYGEHEQTICEIELELKTGAPGVLFDCALQLLETIPLRVDNLSKAARGYALCRPARHPLAVTTGTLALSKHTPVDEGSKRIAADCLAQIQGNQTALIAHDDSESLHQMRVGLRRLHCALDLFPHTAQISSEMQELLAWLASILGPARDWEVLSASILASIASESPDEIDLRLLQAAADEIAHSFRDQARTALQSPRFTRLMLLFSAWIERDAAELHFGKIKQSLQHFADSCVKHDRQRMLRRGKKLDHADPKSCHKLRIATKSARYTIEFFQSLYPAKPVAAYIHALAALQDELGRRNDMVVADKLLQGLEKSRPELRAAIAFAHDALHQTSKGKGRQLHRLWKRFESAKLASRK